MGGYVGTKAVNLSTTAADVSGDANISGSITASGGTFSGDVDFGANKITYANVYAQLSDLPSASTYHGMFAHVHATGKAYFAHAGAWVPLTSGLGIDDNATSTALTLDASGNLLVNTTSTNPTTGTSEGIALQAGGIILASNSSDAAIALNRVSTDGDISIFKKNGSVVGSVGTKSDDLYIGTGDTGFRFNDGNDGIWPIGSSGASRDAAIDLGNSGVRFKDLYLSGGVYLGGTGSANKLDDVEIGTWSPSPSSGGLSTASATYTKVGRMVYIEYNGVLTGTRGSEQFRISGLPFTTAFWTACSMYTQYYSQEGTEQLSGAFQGSSTKIAFVSYGGEALGNHFSNGYLVVNGWYRI